VSLADHYLNAERDRGMPAFAKLLGLVCGDRLGALPAQPFIRGCGAELRSNFAKIDDEPRGLQVASRLEVGTVIDFWRGRD
jgi:hypothetical protein